MQDAERHLPVIRARAAELRPVQVGPEWQALRAMVARLLARLISEHRTERRMADIRPEIGPAICIALTDCEAALSADEGVFYIVSDAPWTVMRGAGVWSVPRDAEIVLLYSNRPPGPLH
jgi:hypothetical protein